MYSILLPGDSVPALSDAELGIDVDCVAFGSGLGNVELEGDFVDA